MRIPEEKIDEVLNATDILDLIGGFVKLRKRGKNYVGLCPFHTEKTPSFNVSPERRMYHCFGCSAGGNVFTFVMEYEKVSFTEAVRSLAEKAGISLPRAEHDLTASEQEQLYQVSRAAGLFYYNCLTETSEGKFALEYLYNRGFSRETIKTFGLGYAPNSWDSLIKHGREQNFSIELLEKAGLVHKRKDGTYYDYFRGRVMFPIFSTTGRVIGFGARKLLENDPLGKYINSPETLIYNKSRILYGISHSKEAIRENNNAILVEGYADLISVFQSGIKNIVASSGTALTQEQIQLISRYAKNITLVYDADSAGSKAAMRGVDLILENDLDVSIAPLPDGDDPDSFVRKHGADQFKKLVDESVSFIDFLAQTFEKEGKFASPEGQAHTVRTIVQTIAKMKDELKRNFYIKHVAEKYKIYESILYRELEKILGTEMRRTRGQTVQSNQPGDEPRHFRKNTGDDAPAVEKDLIHTILEGGEEVVKFIFKHVRLEDFTNPVSRTLVEKILERYEEGESIDPSTLINSLEGPEIRKLISEIIFGKYQLGKGWDETKKQTEEADPLTIAADALTVMRRRTIERTMEENQKALKEASSRGENIIPYLERHKKLLEERKTLYPGDSEGK